LCFQQNNEFCKLTSILAEKGHPLALASLSHPLSLKKDHNQKRNHKHIGMSLITQLRAISGGCSPADCLNTYFLAYPRSDEHILHELNDLCQETTFALERRNDSLVPLFQALCKAILPPPPPPPPPPSRKSRRAPRSAGRSLHNNANSATPPSFSIQFDSTTTTNHWVQDANLFPIINSSHHPPRRSEEDDKAVQNLFPSRLNDGKNLDSDNHQHHQTPRKQRHVSSPSIKEQQQQQVHSPQGMTSGEDDEEGDEEGEEVDRPAVAVTPSDKCATLAQKILYVILKSLSVSRRFSYASYIPRFPNTPHAQDRADQFLKAHRSANGSCMHQTGNAVRSSSRSWEAVTDPVVRDIFTQRDGRPSVAEGGLYYFQVEGGVVAPFVAAAPSGPAHPRGQASLLPSSYSFEGTSGLRDKWGLETSDEKEARDLLIGALTGSTPAASGGNVSAEFLLHSAFPSNQGKSSVHRPGASARSDQENTATVAEQENALRVIRWGVPRGEASLAQLALYSSVAIALHRAMCGQVDPFGLLQFHPVVENERMYAATDAPLPLPIMVNPALESHHHHSQTSSSARDPPRALTSMLRWCVKVGNTFVRLQSLCTFLLLRTTKHPLCVSVGSYTVAAVSELERVLQDFQSELSAHLGRYGSLNVTFEQLLEMYAFLSQRSEIVTLLADLFYPSASSSPTAATRSTDPIPFLRDVLLDISSATFISKIYSLYIDLASLPPSQQQRSSQMSSRRCQSAR
jgi:hypothetical protein